MKLVARLATLFIGVLPLACGGGSDGSDQTDSHVSQTTTCENVEGADTYTAGITKTGQAVKVSLFDADPAPPARDDNTWTIAVADLDGNAIEGASITVSAFMPAHGHYSVVPTAVTDQGGGKYLLSPVNLPMPGLWEVTINVTPPGGTKDSVKFSFCVE